MYFSEEDVQKMKTECSGIRHKYEALLLSYYSRKYRTKKGGEYATHGFGRRIKTIAQCVENVFAILPPDRVEIPSMREVTDATINIQAFVFNVFGGIDNLARIWVAERGLTKEDGGCLPNAWVGLSPGNSFVRASFSPEFQACLCGFDAWFEQLENFRHALAHRIPLYIPPHVVPVKSAEKYRELSDRATKALLREEFTNHARLEAEKISLARFQPTMTHSFDEDAPIIVFHAQLIADFNTIEELGKKMLDELNGLPAA